MSPRPEAAGPEAPAGFWRRAAAWIVDLAILAPLLLWLLAAPWQRVGAALLEANTAMQDWLMARLLSSSPPSLLALAHELLAEPAMRAPVAALQAALGAALLATLLRGAGVAGIYFIAFEAGPWAATPGKRLLRLRVAGLDGRPAGPARIALRFVAGGLSWLGLNIGHALAGWRADRRALHDLVAGTQVLGRGPMPAWARVMLLLVVAASLLAPVFVFVLLLAGID